MFEIAKNPGTDVNELNCLIHTYLDKAWKLIYNTSALVNFNHVMNLQLFVFRERYHLIRVN